MQANGWGLLHGSSLEFFNSTTLGGAKGMGRLEAGALQDIAVVDMQTINKVSCRDPVKNLVNAAFRSDVAKVIVEKDLVVEGGVLLTVDEGRFVDEVQRTTEALWRRIPENHSRGLTSDEVSPQSFCPLDP